MSGIVKVEVSVSASADNTSRDLDYSGYHICLIKKLFLNSTGKSRRPVRRHFTAHFDRDNVATRQVSLQNLYSRLVEMAEVNRICMLSGLGPV